MFTLALPLQTPQVMKLMSARREARREARHPHLLQREQVQHSCIFVFLSWYYVCVCLPQLRCSRKPREQVQHSCCRILVLVLRVCMSAAAPLLAQTLNPTP